MLRVPRLCFQNAALLPKTVISASSFDLLHGPNLLASSSRGAAWRSKPGHNVVAGFNDRFLFQEEDDLRDARIAAGNYPTVTAYTTALEAAMNDAPLFLQTQFGLDAATLWLRASHALRSFEALADGVSLKTWESWQAFNALFDVAEATNPPTFRRAQANGYPAVSFDGSNDKLASTGLLSALLGSGNFTLFAIVNSIAGPTTQYVMSNATGNWNLQYRRIGSSYRLQVSDGTVRTVSKSASQSAFHVVTAMHDGSNIYIGVDDTRTASLASTACGAPVNTGEVITLGGVGGNWFSGMLAELVIYPVVLSEDDRSKVEDSLARKYAVTVASTPSWAGSYTLTYDPDAQKITGTGPLWQPVTVDRTWRTEGADDESAYADTGFYSLSYAPDTTMTAARAVTHSKEYVDFDLGGPTCRVQVVEEINDRISFQVTGVGGATVAVAPGLYEDPNVLMAAVQTALVGAFPGWFTATWNATDNAPTITNLSGHPVVLLFRTGAGAAAGIHRTLGWADTDIQVADGGSTTAKLPLWGWNPTSTAIALDTNVVMGKVRIVVNDQPNQGQVARGPRSALWVMRGDERLRIGQRGELYALTPEDLGRRYVRFIFDDCANEDAYTQVGVLYAGPYAELGPGATAPELSLVPLSTNMQSISGAHFADRRADARRYRCELALLTESDRVMLEFAVRLCGGAQGFFWLEDPGSRQRLLDWTYYVVFAAVPEFLRRIGDGEPPDRYSCTLELQEDLP